MKFEELDIQEKLKQRLTHLNLIEMTPIQEQAIPMIMQGKNVLASSKTGSGKSLAFLVPLLNDIDWTQKEATVLILTPTRELALQISDVIYTVGLWNKIHPVTLIGKESFRFQRDQVRKSHQIIVGTPGRILDHINEGTIDVSYIQHIVLDEVDEMLNIGFIKQIDEILQAISKESQKLMFSATISDTIQELASTYLNDYIKIECDQNTYSAYTLLWYIMTEQHKLSFLKQYLAYAHIEYAILFVNTKQKAEEIYEACKEYISCTYLHGGLLQADRIQHLEAFKQRKHRLLITTNVASRGLDIQAVKTIINYELPFTNEDFIHRMGRSARKDLSGEVVSLLTKQEQQRMLEVADLLQQTATISENEPIMSYVITKADHQYLTTVEDNEIIIEDEVLRLYIGAGKKKKVGAKDIVGAIMQIPTITFDDIGHIDIREHISYVDILNHKGDIVLQALTQLAIKGNIRKIEKANSHS